MFRVLPKMCRLSDARRMKIFSPGAAARANATGATVLAISSTNLSLPAANTWPMASCPNLARENISTRPRQMSHSVPVRSTLKFNGSADWREISSRSGNLVQVPSKGYYIKFEFSSWSMIHGNFYHLKTLRRKNYRCVGSK